MCASFLIQKVKNRTHPPNKSVPEVQEVIVLHCVYSAFSLICFHLFYTEFP